MLKSQNYTLVFVLKLLFIPILYELVVGGGGHFTELGPITFRMLSFFIVMFLSAIVILHRKEIRLEIAVLTTALTLLIFLSAIVGLVNNAGPSAILLDIKPLLFFYMVIFFSLSIRTVKDIELIIKIIKHGSIVMVLLYIGVLILLFTGKMNFLNFYHQQEAIGEILFRGDMLFFYKGFLYLCIGFFFFLLIKSKYRSLALILLFMGILLTLTRGFILFTTMLTLYYIFFINKKVYLKYLTFLILISIAAATPFLLSSLGNRSHSDSVRLTQIEQVISAVNFASFFVGHGFGIGTAIRPGGMEISFLEIFHKQGVIGVSFWVGMFLYIFFLYYKITDKKYKKLALPFLFSVVFVILQSTTNPYMNNPIGLSIILVTLVVFAKLVTLQKQNHNDLSMSGHL